MAGTDSGVVHVLFCANRAYFQHLAVAARSLAEGCGDARLEIHICTREEAALDQARLEATLREFTNVQLRFHTVEDARVSSAFVDRYVTEEAYLRFLAPEILPRDVDRVVYLDCDLVVLGDIRELAACPLRGTAVAAVAEYPWRGPEVERRLAELGIHPDHRYVNSGVLVMDLDRWRRDQIGQKLFEYVAERRSLLRYYDQDALNAVLQGDISLLDLRWNVQPLMLGRWARRENPSHHRLALAALRNSGIVHFTTDRKPWAHRVAVRDRALYFRFLARTAWRGSRPELASTRERVEYDAARALLAARIDVYRWAAGVGAIAERLCRMLPGAPGREERTAP